AKPVAMSALTSAPMARRSPQRQRARQARREWDCAWLPSLRRRRLFSPPTLSSNPAGCYASRDMLTLYSYPTLFGVADNNGYGLKVYAFLKLAGVPFTHEHIFDASKAPRGQLPYIVDDGDTVGDSETILAYVTKKYGVTMDEALTGAQRATSLLITRT